MIPARVDGSAMVYLYTVVDGFEDRVEEFWTVPSYRKGQRKPTSTGHFAHDVHAYGRLRCVCVRPRH